MHCLTRGGMPQIGSQATRNHCPFVNSLDFVTNLSSVITSCQRMSVIQNGNFYKSTYLVPPAAEWGWGGVEGPGGGRKILVSDLRLLWLVDVWSLSRFTDYQRESSVLGRNTSFMLSTFIVINHTPGPIS